ncbi:MAG: ABC transporter permease [Bacteroidetes bacterium]|nr:ABC transporter permease [Bacteroidota bacterium]
MNTELFIARKILFQKNGKGTAQSKPIVNIAVWAIALGVAVMIISVAVLTGFQKQITEKVIGFGGHIQISNFNNNNSFEPNPIDSDKIKLSELKSILGVKHTQIFATKAGIIKTDEAIEGVVLKGITKDYDLTFFNQNLQSGKAITFADSGKTDDILISKKIADKLKFKSGDNLWMYFVQQPPRMRKFKVCGIYESGLEDFDDKYVLCDLQHIQKLNDWNPNQMGGMEISVTNFNELDKVGNLVYSKIGYDLDSKTIREQYPQLFDWLDLQNINVVVILVMMIAVGAINMITALLILILERTNMIGMLKALGANNNSLRKIFLYQAVFLIGKGLLWGNIIGLGLCLLQLKFGFAHLDQASYYVALVPIHLDWMYILGLNIGTLVVCSLILILPSYLVTRISPVKAIRFS